MNRLAYSGLLLAVAMIGCGGAEDDGQIDQALLAQYRAALPQENQVMAKSPEPSMASKLGEPAIYPVGSKDIVVGINGAVGGIVEIMRAIVEQEPSIYSSETKEFFWGPYPNNDGFGFVAAYIREAPAGSDFKYHYALLRGADKDIAKLSPVIWGGATPDPNNKDYGVGVTLWDFEANRAFEEANNPDVANVKLDQGRFVAVYAKGADDAGEAAFVVASFRKFVPKDKPENTPADLDYFYGRFAGNNNTFDFIDYQGVFDINNDPMKAAAETVGVKMAFFNEGTGRAEASASGGDLAANQSASAVECWNAALDETYLSFTLTTDGAAETPITEGMSADCCVFEKTLAE
ncbi:MAG: hypothetical protein L6Q76_37560, partial [Polyangiaceae bacterium]|nr:hypothetical protein [Polyangiaceae bacterium]